MTAASVACRSVFATNSYYFCLLNSNGLANYTYANYSWGVAPGFHNPERGTGQM